MVKINHVTLTDDLEIWGQTSFNSSIHNKTCNCDADSILVSILTFLRSGISEKLKLITWPWRLTFKLKVIHIYYYDLPYLWLYIWYRQDLGVDSYFLKAKDLEKNKINDLTLTVDLERQGQTHFHMTFLIFGCIHDTDIILVSILTKSRSVISNKPKLVNDLDGWPSKSRSSWLFHDLLHFWLYIWYRLDLNVDFIVFDVTDLAVTVIIHLTSTDDLENRSQCYLLWPLVHHGLCTWYRIIFTFELIISDVGNLKMTDTCLLTSIVDLQNQGQTYFQMTFIISGWIHATDLILVLILTYLMSRNSKHL